MPLSRYSLIINHPRDRDQVVLFSTRTLSIIIAPRAIVEDIDQDKLSAEEKKTLDEEGFFVEDLEQEKLEMLGYIDELNRTSTTFTPLVAMNLDCNLACPYCFEGTRKGKHYLSPDTASGVIDFLFRSLQGKNELRVTFYGGEPLLSLDMIALMSEEIRSRADKLGIAYTFHLITNGTLLTRKAVQRLKPLGLTSASVTLDGPKHVHDNFRAFKSGAGSFDTIVRNLREVCDLIRVEIGGNYLASTYREFPELLDHLILSGLGPDVVSRVRFDPVFNERPEVAPDFHDGCVSANEPWIAEASLYLRSEISSRGFKTQQIEHVVCMMERNDHLVVNWDGNLYRCPGLIGREEFRAGTIKQGILEPNVSGAARAWKNDTCLACSYLPLCFGGCRYLKLLSSNRADGVLCRRNFFDSLLPAMVLQDVEAASLLAAS
jgi:uncharacterized protein